MMNPRVSEREREREKVLENSLAECLLAVLEHNVVVLGKVSSVAQVQIQNNII